MCVGVMLEFVVGSSQVTNLHRESNWCSLIHSSSCVSSDSGVGGGISEDSESINSNVIYN